MASLACAPHEAPLLLNSRYSCHEFNLCLVAATFLTTGARLKPDG